MKGDRSPTVKQRTSKCTNLRLQKLIPPRTPTQTSQRPFCSHFSALHPCCPSRAWPGLRSVPLGWDRSLRPERLWVLFHWWISPAPLLLSDCPRVRRETSLAVGQAVGERKERLFVLLSDMCVNRCLWISVNTSALG